MKAGDSRKEERVKSKSKLLFKMIGIGSIDDGDDDQGRERGGDGDQGSERGPAWPECDDPPPPPHWPPSPFRL